jgi:hypothetical protein
MQKIETSIKKKILDSKGTIEAWMKREEKSTDKGRICIPMRTTTLLMTVTVKPKIFSSWP